MHVYIISLKLHDYAPLTQTKSSVYLPFCDKIFIYKCVGETDKQRVTAIDLNNAYALNAIVGTPV